MPVLKAMAPALASAPVEEQSRVIRDIESWLRRWFERKQETTELYDYESELTLMFRLVDGELLMVPCTLKEDDGQDVISRALVESGVNVTRMAGQIPGFALLPIILMQDNNTAQGKLRLQQLFTKLLRDAALHPDARIVSEEDADAEVVNTAALPAYVDYEETTDAEEEEELTKWTVVPVLTDRGDHMVEIQPADEWNELTEEEQDEVLVELGIDRDNLC